MTARNSLFRDPFREIERTFEQAYRASAQAPAMPLDLVRSGDVYTAYIDLPGVDADSIDIDVEDRTLSVRATRKAPQGADLQWVARERTSGTYARQLTLGYGVALDKVEATYADGVLTLSIPVAEEAKPRKIAVKSTSSPATIEAEAEEAAE
ncbi:Hsp20/alpha crystallin family protein [Nanchangia anserum]|uniref:Hsp20/alpha crystallin family protein n=1 Tax=Nanchangia anserum TaxID=2692125 RepID=A0A8I0G7F6_9ACTO|nr:Hsp20/alpha crystallin family protein [Nanchangia anserum]MBD3689250.1 Hsp20/alpha crystallin family protein [Nanchangia anserum]QOX81472.1 Hsp20/alpha crystallin family protein [Nanchangia anserum]